MTTDSTPSTKPQMRHRWILYVGFALTCLAVGLGWGFAKGDLETRAEDAGVALTQVEADVRAGALLLACAAGLAVFCLVLVLVALLNPAPTTGRRVVQWISALVFVAITVGLLAFTAVLYPDIQHNVTVP